MEVIGIGLSLFLLMYFAYMGFSVILFARVCPAGSVAAGSAGNAVVHRTLHGKSRCVCEVIFPHFHARRSLRKVMEDTLLAKRHFPCDHGKAGPQACDARRRHVMRNPDLRRGQPVRRRLRGLSVCRIALREANIRSARIPGTIASAHSPLRWIRSRHAADPEHHPDQFLRKQRICSAIAGLFGGTLILIVGLMWLEMRKKKPWNAVRATAITRSTNRRSTRMRSAAWWLGHPSAGNRSYRQLLLHPHLCLGQLDTRAARRPEASAHGR